MTKTLLSLTNPLAGAKGFHQCNSGVCQWYCRLCKKQSWFSDEPAIFIGHNNMERKKIVLLHALFWTIVFLSKELVGLDASGLSLRALDRFFGSRAVVISLGYLSISMLAFYGANVVAGQVIRKRSVLSIVAGPFLLLAALVAYRAFLELVVFKALFQYNNYPKGASWKYFVPNVVFYYWDFVMYGFGWAVFRHWQQSERNKRLQEIESKNIQLKFLQSQLNPHFLFNTINDIYALSLKKSDQAPQALMQLSGLLRYALYDNKDTTVLLQKELDYINDYLQLQRTGYENRFYVSMQVEGNTEAWQIPPMLLLPFVENACKHGVTQDESSPVRIYLCGGSRSLSFSVVNRIRVAEKDGEGGIGIENIRKRLQLLYPAKHRLQVNTGDGIFKIEMEIEK